MKKAFGWLMMGVVMVTSVTDVPSGYAIMGSRIAMSIAARRAAKKMAESGKTEKGAPPSGEKAVGPGNGNSGNESLNSQDGGRQL